MISTGRRLTGVIMNIFSYLGAITASVVGLIYGIFALIPVAPFSTQNVSVGVTLIVLSVFGVMAIVGLWTGLLVGFIFGSPLLCCDENEQI